METGPVRGDLYRLVRSIFELRRLAEVVPAPLRVSMRVEDPPASLLDGVHPDRARLADLIEVVTRGHDIPNLELDWSDLSPLSSLERVVALKLDLAARLARPSFLTEIRDPANDEVAVAQRIALETPRERFRMQSIRAHDGVSIRTFESGVADGPPVVVANATGMPIELLAPTIYAFERFARVVTWETRAIYDSGDFDGVDVSAKAQANDLCAVMDHAGIDRAHVVGVCAGALVATQFAADHASRLESLCFANGSFALGDDFPATDYERNAWRTWQSISQSRRYAERFHRMFSSARSGADLSDPLAHLTLLPYASPEHLYRYAASLRELESPGAHVLEILEAISVPTLVIASELDEMTHPEAARVVAERVPDCRFDLRAGADHLSILLDPSHAVNSWRAFAAT